MVFDPSAIVEGSVGEGHLDDIPIYQLFLELQKHQETGRLTVHNASGDNHLFFMRGNPVGIQLPEFFHPFGQFLLELGKINGATFLRAQHRIAEGKRLPGQVFMEMGVLEEESLKDVLLMQARRKVKQFCNLGSRPFSFGRGLTFLTGFNATPLDMYAVVYLAISQHLGPESIKAWSEEYSEKEIRCPRGKEALPTSFEAFEFGAAEERFLLRLQDGWNTVQELLQTGTLPDEEVIVLIRFLEIIGNIEIRDKRKDPPAPVEPEAPPAASVAEGVFSPAALTDPKEHQQDENPHRRVHPNAPTDVSVPRIREKRTELRPKPIQVQSLLTQADSEAPPIPRRKKKRKRKKPLPSVSDSAVSSIRQENTMIKKPPSIVIGSDADTEE